MKVFSQTNIKKIPFYYLLLVVSLFLSTKSFAQVVITEIMRDPVGMESQLHGGGAFEFFELTNCGPDTLSLLHLFFSDGDEADSIVVVVDTFPGHKGCIYNQSFLLPGQSALVLDPDYRQAILSSTTRLNIKDSTVLWECGDAEPGDGFSTTDGLIVYKGSESKIDTLLSSAIDGDQQPSTPGTTLTLTVPDIREGVSVRPQNVLSSRLVYLNSSPETTPGWYEHCLDGWILEYRLSTISAKSVLCTLMLQMTGAPLIQPQQWSVFYETASGIKTLQNGELTQGKRTFKIVTTIPLDTFQYSFTTGTARREIDCSVVWTPDKSLRINELYPKSNTSEPEWIEIVNRSPVTINLKNWYFGFGSDTLRICNTDIYLRTGQYCILTANKTVLRARYPKVPLCTEPAQWYTLNNQRDTICLFNQARYPVDTAVYDATSFVQWSTQSIERVDPDKNGTMPASWALSEQSTPGRQNSIVSWRNTSTTSIDVGPIPFTPDGNGVDDLFLIKCTIAPTAKASVSIIAFDGRTLKTFSGPGAPEYFWDGLDNRGKRVENGPFFVKIAVAENGHDKVIRKKGVLWR